MEKYFYTNALVNDKVVSIRLPLMVMKKIRKFIGSQTALKRKKMRWRANRRRRYI